MQQQVRAYCWHQVRAYRWHQGMQQSSSKHIQETVVVSEGGPWRFRGTGKVMAGKRAAPAAAWGAMRRRSGLVKLQRLKVKPTTKVKLQRSKVKLQHKKRVHPKRGRVGQVHHCSLCGSVEHRKEQCPSKAGVEIRALKARIKQLQAQKGVKKKRGLKDKRRTGPQKTGRYKKAARKRYSGKGAPSGGLRPHRTLRVSALVNRYKKDDTPKRTPEQALEWLQLHKFFKEPGSCQKIKKSGRTCGGTLKKALKARYKGQIEYSCSRCGDRKNSKEFSKFKGIRVPLNKLVELLEGYTRLNPLDTPKGMDGASQCTVGVKAAGAVVHTLLDIEAEAGRKQSETTMLSGDLEGDAHGMRSCFISSQNPLFADDIAEAKNKHPGKKVRVWKLWVQVGALCERAGSGGRMILRFLGHNLVLPSAKPPPESKEQIRESKLLHNTKQGSKLFTDGNGNWKLVAEEDHPHLKTASCAHWKYEFAKVVPKERGHSDVAGTQSQDVRWQNMERFIPSTLTTRVGGDVNPALKKYAYAWLWRHNLRSDDMIKALGELCDESV